MNKLENIEIICSKLQGLTKLNFQIQLGRILEEFYISKGLTYEMPSPNGGDDKNDGWVVEEQTFFQIYGPTQPRESLPKDIKKKFTEDLEGLLEHLKKGKWNGKIKKFIFIVNTFDDNLPKDPDRFYDKLVQKMKENTKFDFDYELVNLQYIKRMLFEVDDLKVFDLMRLSLGITSVSPITGITNQNMFNFFINMGYKIMEKVTINQSDFNYKRISSQKKISINELQEKKEEINEIIRNLDVVEQTVSFMNKNVETSELFESIVKYIIMAYKRLSNTYKGVELFNKLCDHLTTLCAEQLIVEIPSKYLIVYVFDHCDIFEKEKVKYNENTKEDVLC